MRQVKGNAPFVGPRGSGTGKQFFICDNAEFVFGTGGGTDFFPTVYPETGPANQGSLFAFPIDKGCLIYSNGTVSSSSLSGSSYSLRFNFNDGSIDSAGIDLGTYVDPTNTGFFWKFDIEVYPVVTYNPEKTVYGYESNSKLEIINRASLTRTVFQEISFSFAAVFTIGETWYPRIGFAVSGSGTGLTLYRNMFRYQER